MYRELLCLSYFMASYLCSIILTTLLPTVTLCERRTPARPPNWQEFAVKTVWGSAHQLARAGCGATSLLKFCIVYSTRYSRHSTDRNSRAVLLLTHLQGGHYHFAAHLCGSP
jgi:hypothetical protein